MLMYILKKYLILCVTELCVDEPEEMYVDDPEEIIQLTERLQGVSVGGPPLVNVSQWTGERPQSAILPC